MRKIRKTIVLESWTTVLVNLTECPKNFFEERGNSVHSDRFPAKSGRIGEQFEGIQAEQQYARRGIPPGVRLSIKWWVFRSGKEGCARETQEGCPAPLKSIVFRTL